MGPNGNQWLTLDYNVRTSHIAHTIHSYSIDDDKKVNKRRNDTKKARMKKAKCCIIENKSPSLLIDRIVDREGGEQWNLCRRRRNDEHGLSMSEEPQNLYATSVKVKRRWRHRERENQNCEKSEPKLKRLMLISVYMLHPPFFVSLQRKQRTKFVILSKMAKRDETK